MFNLCQLEKYSCFGCCGRKWNKEKVVLKQIEKNTKSFREMSKEDFSLRGEVELSASGGCKSLIFSEKKVLCPLHPSQNKGRDFRDRVCDKSFLCNTFRSFLKWPKKKQDFFVKFLLDKELSHYDYSMGMDSGSFMDEFLSDDKY